MRIPRWKTALVVLGAVGVLVAIPIAVSAVTQTFNDVPSTDWAYDDVEWLAANDLTNGCTSDGTLFCPDSPVTRREMAAFMHRLATKRVVNAGTIDGLDSNDFVMNTEWVTKSATFSSLAVGNPVFAEATCPKPKHVVSGGGLSIEGRLVMIASHPSSGDTAWTATWSNLGPTPLTSTVTTWALCEGPELRTLPLP